MGDQADTGDAAAAMAAMGLPSNFAAPAFPSQAGRGAVRPPPPGPSSRGSNRGRDTGWRGRGRGRGEGPAPGPYSAGGPPSQAPTGPAAMRGSNPAFVNARGSGNKRKRGGVGIQSTMADGPLLPLEEVPPLLRPSFTEEDPWAHLS